MKNLYLITAILFSQNYFFSQEVLKAKLVEFDESKLPPYCGYSERFGMLKLTLMEDSKRLNFGDTIFIFQMCPRELMEFDVGLYENNKIYKLNLGKRVKKIKFNHLKISVTLDIKIKIMKTFTMAGLKNNHLKQI